MLIIANVVKSGQLLLYHYIEKDGDSLSCTLQGFLLIGTEVFSTIMYRSIGGRVHNHTDVCY